jgi:hypothetical protein
MADGSQQAGAHVEGRGHEARQGAKVSGGLDSPLTTTPRELT